MKLYFNKKLMALIAVPLAFAVLGYSILFFSAKSVINPVISIWNMMKSDSAAVSNESYTDLYDGQIFHTYTDTIPSSVIKFPNVGTRYGEITIEGTKVKCPLFFGDSDKNLRLGVGQYMGSSFPGMGSTLLIGGHNNTYFRDLKSAKVGAIVTVSTHYGEYTYRITETAIKKNNDSSAYDLGAEKENLVLYTCYPFNTLGLTSKRYFVYAEYVSGPRILLDR